MSVVAKILIVVNLLLAVAFLAASATYLGAKTSAKKELEEYKIKAQAEIQTLTSQKETLQADVSEAEANAREAEKLKRDAEAKLKAKEDVWDDVDKAFQAIKEAHVTLVSSHEAMKNDLSAQVERNSDLTKQAAAAIRDKEGAVTRENAAVADKQRLEDELITARQQLADGAKALNRVQTELGQAKLKIKGLEDAYGPASDLIGTPALDAVVTGVSTDVNLVMLSLGRDDGVKKGFELTIYRGGEYVGKVIVDQVSKDHSTAYSVKAVEKTPIRVGDRGTTRF
jgi:DNA repair exonuclease SbcCD ATPase subunit